MESHLSNRLGNSYERAGDAHPLQLRADSRRLLALFFPAPTLIKNTDPRSVAGTSLREIRKAMGAQVRDLLRKFDVPVRRSSKARSLWYLLAAIEGMRERLEGETVLPWSLIRKYWLKVAGEAPGQREIMGRMMDQWGQCREGGY